MNKQLNENNPIDEMMTTATEDADMLEPKQNQNKNYKKIIITTLLIITILGIAIYLYTINIDKPQEDIKDLTKQPEWVNNDKDKNEQEIIEQKDAWDFEYPVEVPIWSKQPYNVEDILLDENIYSELITFANQFRNVEMNTTWMPSNIDNDNIDIQGENKDKPAVYTKDISQQLLENGVSNPHFKYALKEDYLSAYSVNIQRLLNPVFGNWIFAQRYTPNQPLKNDQTFETLIDMFSQKWWTDNITPYEDYSAIPVISDWNGDDFAWLNQGTLKFAERQPGRYGTFFGVINETNEEIVMVKNLGRDDQDCPILEINTPVKYVAFGIDDKPIEIYGNLVLTLSSNENYIDIYNRIIIQDAKLILH